MAILINEDKNIFYLNTENTTYAFMVTPTGFLKHLYYGRKITDYDEDLEKLAPKFRWGFSPEYSTDKEGNFSLNQMLNEYSSFGLGDYREAAIKITYSDGSRNNDFKFVSYEIHNRKTPIKGMPSLRGNNELVVTLKDEHCELKLYYSVYEAEDVISRRASVRNIENNKVIINSIMSGELDAVGDGYVVSSLSGEWGRERNIFRHPLNDCIITIDSKRGVSGHSQNPFVLLSREDTDEYNGLAIGMNLVYSGSFTFRCEHTFDHLVRIVSGINDFDFSWPLESGESFETPELVMCLSCEGVNRMSQGFHDVYRQYLINPKYAHSSHPIVLNNWEATSINFTKENLISLIDEAAALGIDTFVLDDGWFGDRENGFDRGLGDWTVNERKLSGGLRPIIDECKKHGMKFGLWFEPEMISENSDVYRVHPEYAMKSPKGILCRNRDQLVMDLVNPEASDYVKNSVSKVLDDNEISYVKWDCNRNLSEYYSHYLKPEEQGAFAHRYMLAVYDLLDYFTIKYPDVFFEGCSGGGGRFDPAMLYYFPQIWCSDNSDAYSREFIQYGTSLCYPLSSFTGHVSVCPSHVDKRITPFETRCNIASLCSTGYELDITKLTEEEKRLTAENVERYRDMEDLILDGDLYRTDSPFDDGCFGEVIVSKDKSRAFAVFAVGEVKERTVRTFRFRGIDDGDYFVSELGAVRSGKELKTSGICLDFTEDYQSYSFTLVRK